MNQIRATIEQDLILVYAQGQPLFFARVEKIEPDVKKGWWRLTMLVLQIPVRIVTWILDEEQIRGADFTMGGIPIRLEIVIPPTEPLVNDVKPQPENSEPATAPADAPPAQTPPTPAKARILSMGPRKDS